MLFKGWCCTQSERDLRAFTLKSTTREVEGEICAGSERHEFYDCNDKTAYFIIHELLISETATTAATLTCQHVTLTGAGRRHFGDNGQCGCCRNDQSYRRLRLDTSVTVCGCKHTRVLGEGKVGCFGFFLAVCSACELCCCCRCFGDILRSVLMLPPLSRQPADRRNRRAS